jgi:hypothetical protein
MYTYVGVVIYRRWRPELIRAGLGSRAFVLELDAVTRSPSLRSQLLFLDGRNILFFRGWESKRARYLVSGWTKQQATDEVGQKRI